MRLHRFFVENPIEKKTFDITNQDLIHQWRTVFRYNVGSQVIVFDGSGVDYLCIITSLRNLGATVTVLEKMEGGKKQKRIVWVCLSLIKKNNFELAVEKITEIGVSNIVPVLSERSEKKNLNLERLKKIVKESSEQSGRADVPVIHPIIMLKEILNSELLPKKKIVLHLEGKYIKDLVRESDFDLAVFIGPEGGFSQGEIGQFSEKNIPSVCFGEPVLRSETAAIAVSSLLLL